MNKRIAGILFAVLSILLLASGCEDSQSATDKRDRAVTDSNSEAMSINQPVPAVERSQLRQSLIDIQEMQTTATATFSFFFLPGRSTGAPLFGCSSIGDPIPATYQLTNPLKGVRISDSGGAVAIPQAEPTGIFSGPTEATNTICVDEKGQGFKQYWEGPVMSSTIAMEWNDEAGQMVVTPGATPTADFAVEEN